MKCDVVRAWKDESYRASLSETELGQLPANPAGELVLSDADLESIYGDGGSFHEGGSNLCHFAVITGSNIAVAINAIVNIVGATLGAAQGASASAACIH